MRKNAHTAREVMNMKHKTKQNSNSLPSQNDGKDPKHPDPAHPTVSDPPVPNRAHTEMTVEFPPEFRDLPKKEL